MPSRDDLTWESSIDLSKLEEAKRLFPKGCVVDNGTMKFISTGDFEIRGFYIQVKDSPHLIVYGKHGIDGKGTLWAKLSVPTKSTAPPPLPTIPPPILVELKDNTIDPKAGVKYHAGKAPIFTFCKQFKGAIEQLALRSLYGHEKYIEYDADWQNFARVPDGDETYANANFRHALEIGDDEDYLEHLKASAWSAIARLQCHLNEKDKLDE